MSYTLDYSLALGPAFTSIADLRAQLVDTTGASVGGAVSTGFTEIGNGFYLWHYAAFPNNHRGGVKFYQNSIPGTILAFTSINPEEVETASTIGTRIISGAYTYDDMMRLLGASQGGLLSGANTATVVIGDVSQTKSVITCTRDTNNNRTAVTLDLTP